MTEQDIMIVFDKDFLGKCDGCGACCTHACMSSVMPDGRLFTKPAGVRCEYLTEDNRCAVWGDETRQPRVCRDIQPLNSFCRFDLRDDPEGPQKHAIYLQALDRLTSTDK